MHRSKKPCLSNRKRKVIKFGSDSEGEGSSKGHSEFLLDISNGEIVTRGNEKEKHSLTQASNLTLPHSTAICNDGPSVNERAQLPEDVLMGIAKLQSVHALARMAQLSRTSFAIANKELQGRYSGTNIDVHLFLNGVRVQDVNDNRDASLIVQKMCSLMDFVLHFNIEITGFCNYPISVWKSMSEVTGRMKRSFNKALVRCFAELPLSEVHYLYWLMDCNAVKGIANQYKDRLTSIDLFFGEDAQSQMKCMRALGKLESLREVSLRLATSCPVLLCNHGRTVYESDTRLWPDTLRFAAMSNIKLFRLAFFGLLEDGCWEHCQYLNSEISINSNTSCHFTTSMPSLQSLSLSTAPENLLRRLYDCNKDLRSLCIGHRSQGRAMLSVPAIKDVYAMFRYFKHYWTAYDAQKMLIDNLKLVMTTQVVMGQSVLASAELALLFKWVYEVFPNLKKLELTLSLPEHVNLYTFRDVVQSEGVLTHFSVHISHTMKRLQFESLVHTLMNGVPQSVESFTLSVSSTIKSCVMVLLSVIRRLEDIASFSFLESVHFQVEGDLPCLEILLIQVKTSLESMREISILATPLAKRRNELINNLRIFLASMNNLQLLRLNANCIDLLIKPKRCSTTALDELCRELDFEGVIEVATIPELDEWDCAYGQMDEQPDKTIQTQMSQTTFLLILFADLVASHDHQLWSIPKAADFGLDQAVLDDCRVKFELESEDSSNYDESSLDSVESFVIDDDDVEYDEEVDLLDRAENILQDEDPSGEEASSMSHVSDDVSEGSLMEPDSIEDNEDEQGSEGHNSFLDNEAQEDNAGENSEEENENSDEESVLSGETDNESMLRRHSPTVSDSGSEPDLAQFVDNQQDRVKRKRIIISDSDEQ